MNYNLPLITIQILNWNRCEDTIRAIESALSQSYPNIEIVVVDNGSTDLSVETIRRRFANIQLVELGENHGCPGGRNLGVPYCNGDYIFYLDNDGVLHEKAVENAYASMSKDEGIGVVTGTIYDFINESEIDSKCKIQSHSSYFYNRFQGGISLHRKSIYKTTGLYPAHFIYGGEEYFLACKIIESGMTIVKDESVILWHKRSLMARDREKELLNSYFNKLYISTSLYPTNYAVLFAVYFLPKYFYYAFKEGIVSSFLKTASTRYIGTIKKGLSERKPLNKHIFARIRKVERVDFK